MGFKSASCFILAAIFAAGLTACATQTSRSVIPDTLFASAAGTTIAPLVRDLRAAVAKGASKVALVPDRSAAASFPSLEFSASAKRSTDSIANANDFEEAGVLINSGGHYTGIYAEHTLYLPASFPLPANHGGSGLFPAPRPAWEVVEGPLSRPPNGGCLSTGTYAANEGSGTVVFWGINDWCVPNTASVIHFFAVDATFMGHFIRNNSRGLPVYATEVVTPDSVPTSASTWYVQLYDFSASAWVTEFQDTGLLQVPFGYSGFLAAHLSGQCPGSLPTVAADQVQLYNSSTQAWEPLAPTMSGLTSTVLPPDATMGCFNADSSGAATDTFSVPSQNNYWSVTTIAAPATSCPDVTSSPSQIIFGYYPCDLSSAYSLPSATNGSNQTVAIIDAMDDPTAESDLVVYRSTFGLPPCITVSGCFKKVDQNGGTSYPAPNASWAQEISLDLDMVSAICPNCNILLVEATSASHVDLGAAVNYAAGITGVAAISNSYGFSESSIETTTFDAYYNHPGIAITASAGDSGYGVLYPAASRYVTAVGGTSLYRAGNARGWSETAWGSSPGVGTGSGCSAYETKPSWQADGGCARRMVADVSAVADTNTGVAVYDSYSASGWQLIGGTSAAAPIIAAVYALAGNPSTLNYASSIYGNVGALYDVVGGSNGTCITAYFCNALVGYDGPTGMGTPRGLGAFGGTTSLVARNVQSRAVFPTQKLRRVTAGPSEYVCGPPSSTEIRCTALRRTDVGWFHREANGGVR